LARQLTQQEIDAVFRKRQPGGAEAAGPKAAPFDFRRLDRIPKSQLRAIRLLHDNFVRNLASSLSAYLRTYIGVNLVSVEQLSYAEFLDGLSSPTCLVSLGLRPYEGSAVMELNPGMTFPILEALMGGKSKVSTPLDREITEIERNLLEGLLRIILRDLKEAWETITSIDFKVDSMETDPQMLQVLDPGEAFVATGIEVRVGEAIGMMNLAIPSLIIKMMRTKFSHQGAGSDVGSVDEGAVGLGRPNAGADVEPERVAQSGARRRAAVRLSGHTKAGRVGSRGSEVPRTGGGTGTPASLPY
jgi:flagellar motor switch protein FliM